MKIRYPTYAVRNNTTRTNVKTGLPYGDAVALLSRLQRKQTSDSYSIQREISS